jgi:hypothetical protein
MAETSIFGNVNVMQTITSVALGLICFFCVRTLSQIDRSQKVLFSKYDKLKEDHDELSLEFAELKGEHRVRHKSTEQ